jgi:tetratricopeptide (TPR) repeat protein
MTDEALRAERRAADLEPGVPWPYWGIVRVHAQRREIERAREWLERARLRFGSHPRTTSLEILLLLEEKRYAEALELLERSPESAQDPLNAMAQATCLMRLGRMKEAEPCMARCAPFADVDMDWAALHAGNLGIHGDRDEAFRYLERAVALGNDSLSLYEDDVLFGELHSEPRWKPFIEGVRVRVERWRAEFAAHP